MFGTVQFSPTWTDGTAVDSTTINLALALANGMGDDQADSYWAKTYSLAAGGDDSFDLTALPRSVFGATGNLYLWKAKAFVLRNLSPVTTFTVGGSPTNRWSGFSSSGTLAVAPDGIVVATAPKAGFLVSNTSKVMSIVNTDQAYTLTGNTTSGQVAVTGLSSTSSLLAGMSATGTGIPAGATIAAITSGTAITLSAAATAAGTGVSLSFVNPSAELQVMAIGVLD
jgi:hypothetical protein